MTETRQIYVSGLPGSGKSTLSAALSQHLGWQIIAFDDYEVLTQLEPAALEGWLSAGGPLHVDLAPGFSEAINAAAGPIIVDGPFGSAWPGVKQQPRMAVWLDCAMDIALARKLSALAKAARSDPEFAVWLGGWLDHYPAFTRRTYQLLQARVQSSETLRIDAELSTKGKINQVLRAIDQI